MKTHLMLKANIASGDHRALDLEFQCYCDNFGGLVFDYGATAICGAFSHGNTASLRLLSRPTPQTRLLLALGHFRLASKRRANPIIPASKQP